MAKLLGTQHQDYLDHVAGLTTSEDHIPLSLPQRFRICIVGGGISGLYSAILLQRHFPGVDIKIFEASDRVGGAVYTYRYSSEPHQYFEAGAMRLPCIDSHQPVFSLIEYLNEMFPDDPIRLIDFKYLNPESNRVFVNNTKQKNGCIMSVKYATENYKELGFTDADKDANKLHFEAFKPVSDELESHFEEALKKYKDMSVRDYLRQKLGWSSEKIDYLEVMCATSNYFYLGIIEYVCHLEISADADYSWKTIEGGMSKLPEQCANAVRKNGGSISLKSKVESISQNSQSVRIGVSQLNSTDLVYEEFDSLIVAIPLPFLRKIIERPYFGKDFERALRLPLFEPASKLGLKFNSRFWERPDLDPPPSFGGQSVTDLSVRWVLYPSHGVGEKKESVLSVYNHTSDGRQWQLLSKEDKIKTALHDLQLLYPEVDISKEYAGGEPGSEHFLNEAFEVDWWGLTMYYPGQFQEFYPVLVKPRGNIYFTGGYLASSLAWILSALESTKRMVSMLARKYGIQDIDYV